MTVSQVGSVSPILDAFLIQPITGADRFYSKPNEFTAVDISELKDQAYRDMFKRVADKTWCVMIHGGGLTGTDPEIFAFDQHGEVIPAWKWLKTKKENPAIYWDGVQAECTVDPKGCHEYLTDRVQARLQELYTALIAHDKQAILRAQDVVELDEKTLLLASEDHINLGCSPSRNIYDEIKPIEIGDSRAHKFRYAGTHLHFSYSSTCASAPDWWPHGVVAMLDKIGGIALTALGRDLENPIRRKAYGRPGEFRLPGEANHRLEYRTPGAYILQHPAVFNFAADICRAAYRFGFHFNGLRDDLLPNDHYKDIIINCDADAALKYMQANKAVFEQVLGAAKVVQTSKTWKALSEGIKKFGIYDTPVHENWLLSTTQWERQNNNPHHNWSRFCESKIT